MKDELNRSQEEMFVIRLAQCIRMYNAINTPMPYPLSEKAITELRKELKEISNIWRSLEPEIIEKHKLNPSVFKSIVNDLYSEMNAEDKGFVMGDGSPLFSRLQDFIAKFVAAVLAISQNGAIGAAVPLPNETTNIAFAQNEQLWQSKVLGL